MVPNEDFIRGLSAAAAERIVDYVDHSAEPRFAKIASVEGIVFSEIMGLAKHVSKRSLPVVGDAEMFKAKIDRGAYPGNIPQNHVLRFLNMVLERLR